MKKNRPYCRPEVHMMHMDLTGLVMASGQIEVGMTDGGGSHTLPADAKRGEIDWDF